jgi:hypothetical protein
VIIRRGVTHRVQMPQQYEWVELTASVEVDTEQLDRDIALSSEVFLQQKLDDVIAEDLKQAQELSESASYVREWE